MRSTEVGSFHKRNFAAETAGRCAAAELVAAERNIEVANIAGLGMKKGRKAHEPGCHNHGLDDPVVGGDDKRQDQRSSWCFVGLVFWSNLGTPSMNPRRQKWRRVPAWSSHNTGRVPGVLQGYLVRGQAHRNGV
jgi:hypothetical protein